ncbi:MAG TPA: hypothetical protein PLI98_04855 [Candidatus Hydrogenedentes bacterium]|nr:hypothetical protein [Candidatus Hydrogenedentota bacterium]
MRPCHLLLPLLIAAAAQAQPLAGLYGVELDGTPWGPVAEAAAAALTDAGYAVERLPEDSFAHGAPKDLSRFAVLALPHAGRLPKDAVAALEDFAKAGGDLFALDTPLGREALVPLGGRWMTVPAFREAYAAETPKTPLVDFASEDISKWRQGFRTAEMAGKYAVANGALSVEIAKMDGWDTFAKDFASSPFPGGHTATLVRARAVRNVTHLAVEWTEADGSRWIASMPLSAEWRDYVLTPEDFHFWESVPARADTSFNPENARTLTLTQAFTHTGYADRDLAYEVASVHTAPLSEEAAAALRGHKPVKLETLCPAYKFFPVSDTARLRARGCLEGIADPGLPGAFMGLHPRPTANGFDKGRAYAWEPLLAVESASGDYRGAVASLLSHADGPFKGGKWASFAVQDPAWYLSPAGREALARTARRFQDPVVLVDGGADFFTCLEGQELRLGATLFNRGPEAVKGLRVAVSLETGSAAKFEASDDAVRLAPGETRQVAFPVPAFDGAATASVRVERGGETVAMAAHEVHAWKPRTAPKYVTAADGRFELGGARWRPHGINYMPSSGVATEDQPYFERWLSRRSYDPEVIQRDLERCRNMGCNALSVFLYYDDLKAQNLLDLLRRMVALGMKANVSLRPGTPMEFPWEQVREMITSLRLAENDTVFAYDLAWEPQFRPFERDPFNKDWEAWIIERYGSLESAEKEWGVPVPRDAHGNIANFTEEMIGVEGPWSPMIAAYRRFLDTLLYAKYSRARDLVRRIDPNHHVSFRMSMAGDPTDTQRNTMLYDFAYLGGAVDLFEPEAYGRIGDWERVKPGAFTQTYARWANPALPMIWAEAGVHVWDMASMSVPEEKLAFQERFYTDFYRMILQSGADGIFWWWYPGGFRSNENSDYGVINPDGTDRPVTAVIRKHAPLVENGPDPATEDPWLVFDRDSHTNGLSGVYTALQAEYWAAVTAGKTPGLRTEGTGTTSADCPLVAVGNRPCTGSNPPKYLDAYFDAVLTGGGKLVESGATVSAAELSQVPFLVVTLTNLGEAALLGGADATGPGTVMLTATVGGAAESVPLPRTLARFERTRVRVPLPKEWQAPCELVLSLEARERTPFGPRPRISVAP